VQKKNQVQKEKKERKNEKTTRTVPLTGGHSSPLKHVAALPCEMQVVINAALHSY